MSQPPRIVRFAILRHAALWALQWRLLLLWILAISIPTALLALPVVSMLAAHLEYSVHAPDWARAADLVMVADLMEQFGRRGDAFGGSGIAAGIALLAAIPFLNAMFVGASRSDQSLRLGQLLHGGIAEYGPMLRLLLVAVLPLGIALGLGGALMKAAHKYSEHAILESDAERVTWAAKAVAALLFAYAHAGVDAGRAWLAFDPRRRSAVKAWWRGAKLVFFHPLRSLGLYLGVTLIAVLVVGGLTLLRLELATGHTLQFLAGLLVVQAIVAVTAWMHYARLYGLLELTRAESRP